MSAITLDAELRARLSGLNEQLEVRDEAGRTVGHFVPQELYRQLLSSWGRAKFGDTADREQALQEVRTEGGLTTAEAVAHLEQLASRSRGTP
jgi:hypothetical protein